jgi:AcrR family transcriptional regulator
MNVHSTSQATDPSRADRLLAAAAEVFAEHGFEAATVHQIAAAAGVSTGLLYRYFPSKAELARAIVRQFHEQDAVALSEVATGGLDPEVAFVTYLKDWVNAATDDPRACALIAEIAGLAVRDPHVRADVIAVEQHGIEVLSAILERAGVQAAAARAHASLAVCTLDGIALRIAIDPLWDPRPALDALVVCVRSSSPTRQTSASRP